MTSTDRNAASVVAWALLVTVATQIFYITVVSNAESGDLLRRATWSIEAAAFTLVALAGMALAARDRAASWAWAAIALSGILNLLQVGMGLSMFGPAGEARAQLPALMGTVLAGAFFLYFHAKVLLGLAAIGFGRLLLGTGGAAGKAVGGLAIGAGAIAAVLGALGIVVGMDWVYPAGTAGTVATALLALALLLTRPEDS